MRYRYEDERAWVLTDEGSRQFMRMRDWVLWTLKEAGAVTSGRMMSKVSAPDTFKMLACVDRMVELGELRELTGPEVAGQYRVFVKAGES